MRILIASTFLVLLFAGCTGEPSQDAGPRVPTLTQCGEATSSFTPPPFDLITPAIWQINATTDRILVWAHNTNTSRSVNVTWGLQGINGTALPQGWNASFEPPSLLLRANGTKLGSGRSTTYPDWGWSMATIRVPSVKNTTVEAQLTDGRTVRNVTLHAHVDRANVTGPGDMVLAHYDGRFHDDGQPFDDGMFETLLGSGETVTGFDRGLMGLAPYECQRLVIPPALAYGYDNTSPGYTRFNGEWLRFEVWVE